MANLKQTINEVTVNGLLVKNGLEMTMNKEKTARVIRGALTIRTLDGSEHEVNYYANEFKKDKETKQFTTEKSGMFNSLETVLNEYKDLQKYNKEEADVVSITGASFDVNDYKGRDGVVRTSTRIKSNFANRVAMDKMETTKMTSTFEIEGIVEKIDEELVKGEPTGNMKVVVNVLGYQGTVIPVTLISAPNCSDYIRENYNEGDAGLFWGRIVNTSEKVTQEVQGGFGESHSKTFTTYVRKYEVTGGTPPKTIDEINIEEDDYNQAKAKRKLKLDNLQNEEKKSSAPTAPPANGFGTTGNGAFGGGTTTTGASGFGAGQTTTPSSNPFGGGTSSNPFAK